MLTKSKPRVCLFILQTFMFCLFTEFVHAQVIYENTGQNWTYTYGESGTITGLEVNEIRASEWDYNIYAVGRVPRTGSYGDFTVINIDTLGDTNWVYRYNGPANKDNKANTLIIDNDYYSSGYIYAAGFSVASNNRKDLIVIKLDPATGDISMWQGILRGSLVPILGKVS
jgi:hypothetical protein